MEHSARPLNTDVTRFNFLFKKISMPHNCLREWFQVPEFADKVNELLDSSETIDDQVILQLGSSIIDEKAQNRKANKDFHFQTLRRGLNHVRKTIESSNH